MILLKSLPSVHSHLSIDSTTLHQLDLTQRVSLLLISIGGGGYPEKNSYFQVSDCPAHIAMTDHRICCDSGVTLMALIDAHVLEDAFLGACRVPSLKFSLKEAFCGSQWLWVCAWLWGMWCPLQFLQFVSVPRAPKTSETSKVAQLRSIYNYSTSPLRYKPHPGRSYCESCFMDIVVHLFITFPVHLSLLSSRHKINPTSCPVLTKREDHPMTRSCNQDATTWFLHYLFKAGACMSLQSWRDVPNQQSALRDHKNYPMYSAQLCKGPFVGGSCPQW